MLLSKRIKLNLFLFYSLLLTSIPNFAADATAPIEQVSAEAIPAETAQPAEAIPAEFNAQIQKQIDTLWNALSKQARDLDTYCEDIALLIRNNVLKTKKKDIAIKGLSEIRRLLYSIHQRSSVSVTIDDIIGVEFLLKSLTSHLSLILQKNTLSKFATFDPHEAFKTIPIIEDDTIILTTIEQNERKIAKLHDQISNSGICWYNKAYRAFNYLVIAPTAKYNIHTWAASALIFGGISWFLYSRWQSYATDDVKPGDIKPETAKIETPESKVEEPKSESETSPRPKNLDKLSERVVHGPKQDPAVEKLKEQLNEEIKKAQAQGKKYETKAEYLDEKITALDRDAAKKPKKIGTSDKISNLFIESKYYLEVGSFIGLPLFANAILLPQAKEAWRFIGKKALQFHYQMLGGVYAAKGAPKDTVDNAVVEPRYTFTDVIGNEHTKEMLSRIKYYLEDPERFDSANIHIPKGYLFGGPSRAGKTFMAEALAGEIKAHLKLKGKDSESFTFLSITNLDVTAYGIHAWLALAKKKAPCLLFIDEIDLLGLQRTTNQAQLSEFLTAMSGCMENNLEKQVILIAATNRAENIEEALCKPGRFGVYIPFTRPTAEEKKSFITRKLESFAIDSKNFDIDLIVRETGEDTVFAALDDIINTALLDAKRHGVPLTQTMLEKALDEDIHHIVSANKCNFTDEEKTLICAHYAGHALAMILLDGTHKLSKVTINPIAEKPNEEPKEHQFYQPDAMKKLKEYGETGRVFWYRSGNGTHAEGAKELLKQCKQELSGYAAEKVLLGECGYGNPHPDDGSAALNIAIQICSKGLQYLMWKQFPDDIKKPYIQAALQLKEKCEQEIETVLASHKALLQAIADELFKKHTLSRMEIDAIIRTVEPTLIPQAA